jgi:myo-inositol-1(or 4)-monophosphatase
MTVTDTALSADWLGACRRAVAGLEDLLCDERSTAQRAVETGTRGVGGDRTLVLDQSAEDIVFAQLQGLHAEGHNFTVLSEERGELSYGDAGGREAIRVIVDPIDGSLNAKRDACHYALSVAVADGETMADVAFAFVHDFGCGEQWWARRGEGAWRDGERLDPTLPERRNHDGKLELLAIESADPRWVRDHADALVEVGHRLRALGAIAITLCQVASARYDGMLTLRRSRGVDAAAGQLIVREAGGLVAFPDFDPPLAAPLDATPRSRLVAARSPEALDALARVGA